MTSSRLPSIAPAVRDEDRDVVEREVEAADLEAAERGVGGEDPDVVGVHADEVGRRVAASR